MLILKNLAKHKLAVLAIILLLVVQAFCDLSLPTFTANIVNVGIEQSGIELTLTNDSEQTSIQDAKAQYEALGYDLKEVQMNYLLKTGGMMLACCGIGVIAAICLGALASVVGAKIGRDLREKLFSKVVAFSDAEVQRFGAASLITRATNDVQQVQMVSVMLLRMVFYAPILALGGIVMIAQTNLSLGWIVIVAIVAVGLILVMLMKIALPKFKIMQKLIDKVNLISRETLTGLSVIRAFGREEFEEARFDEASLRLMKTQLFTNRVMTFMMPTMMLIMNAVSAAIIWFGGFAVDGGEIQTGSLIAFITYAVVIIMGFLMLGMISIMLPRANVAAKRIDEVINCPLSIQDPATSSSQEMACEAGKKQAATNGSGGAEIAFNNVSFKYADGANNVLENVTFTAHAGQTTAIIGSTGCGKSTILKLIERFYDVTGGSITVDGVDVRNMTQHDLRSQFGYVPQKAFLFDGTIESNIAYGRNVLQKPNAASSTTNAAEMNQAKHPLQQTIKQAAEIAQASEFIDAKPTKFNTPIAQGGTNVSGGQRQRLAIARALATGARAFLFDDSFSALDYKTDAALRHELANKLAGTTVIIVAQRISTVIDADQIIVLEQGKLVGKGTHKQLLDSCKEYKEIATSQLSADELEGR